ncbi:hypothetical protein PybrP1_009139 [[Pythium] brassicae (nom. inval.)]|nr:hypothetical protein PybrP1_009139 [[Pythium] brassicae (nom. inval.)]
MQTTSSSSAAATRLRCDPTDYARRQQEKKDRARDLREQRSKGVFSDDHTFSPKTNPKARAPEREEPHERPPATNSLDDIPIRPAAAGDASDTLDHLSRRYPKKAPPPKPASTAPPVPLEPVRRRSERRNPKQRRPPGPANSPP